MLFVKYCALHEFTWKHVRLKITNDRRSEHTWSWIAKHIRNPFTTSFSNADTSSSFGRIFNITITHWQENLSVWPYKVLLQAGILCTNCPLLNYLILITKLYLWGCRRNQTLPFITVFSSKVKIKYETEKYCYVLKLIKRTNLIRSGLRLWTLYPSVICT